MPCFGKPGYFMPRCICQCQREAEEQRKAPRNGSAAWSVQAPEGPGPARPLSVRLHLCQRQRPKSLMDKAPRLCGDWKEAYRNNTGLLLFGDVGTGKSFFAGCIANALLDRDVPVLMTNFPTIPEPPDGGCSLRTGPTLSPALTSTTCLSLTIWGVERSTEYAMEQMFFVIDSRLPQPQAP